MADPLYRGDNPRCKLIEFSGRLEYRGSLIKPQPKIKTKFGLISLRKFVDSFEFKL